MSNYRSIFVLAVLATFVAVAQCKDLMLGERLAGDSLVYSTHIELLPYAVPERRSISVRVNVPKDELTITAVKFIDRNAVWKYGTYVESFEGGPGAKFCTAHFIIESGQVIQYDIFVYGI